MGRRTWIKIFSSNWLRGSIRKETAQVRGVFADLLAAAGDSEYGDDGIIQLADSIGLTDDLMAWNLNLPIDVWLEAKERLSHHPSPEENRIKIIPLQKGYAIQIVNWKKYQSEYRRQKKYRKKSAKINENPGGKRKSYCQGYTETEKEIETEKEKENYIYIQDFWNLLARWESERRPKVQGLIKVRGNGQSNRHLYSKVRECLIHFDMKTIKRAIYNYHRFMCLPDNRKRSPANRWTLGQFLSNIDRVAQYQDWNTVEKNWLTNGMSEEEERIWMKVMNNVPNKIDVKWCARVFVTIPKSLHPRFYRLLQSKTKDAETLYYRAMQKYEDYMARKSIMPE